MTCSAGFAPAAPPRFRARPHPWPHASLSPSEGRLALPYAPPSLAPARMSASPQGDVGGDDAPPSLDGKDWREARAVLHAGGIEALEELRAKAARDGFHAFPLSLPETGCCLASHPAFYRRGKMYMTQSVVFLASHDETGTIGYILNRPLAGTCAQLASTGLFGRSTDLTSSVLASAPVYLGGPDAIGDHAPVAVIHSGSKSVDGSIEPLSGVFMSSIDVVKPLVESGELPLDDVRLFSGCVRWRPGELLAEVEAGEWFAASASSAFPLSHCIGLPTPLWRELMSSMSEVHKKIAQNVYGED